MALFSNFDDTSINSVLGLGSSIKGDIKVNGFTRVDGDLDGNLETTGNVLVGANARIRGNITAKSITISGGIIQGNIIAQVSVKLLADTVVIGDIQAHKIFADDEVIIHGHCIALTDETAYNEAVKYWQSSRAISSKSILQNLSINTSVFKKD